MSEKKARHIRQLARRMTPEGVSPERQYAAEVRTARERVAVARVGTQADGSPQMGKVKVVTVTFRLAKECARFYDRRAKKFYRSFIRRSA